MLLIHPPVAKPGEPPAGIAMLSGALAAHGIGHRVLDLSLEGLLFLLRQPQTRFDTWTNRAFRNRDAHIASLRNADLFRSMDRYRRAVLDLSRVLETVSRPSGGTVGLANYQHETLSPLRSSDLLQAAGQPERNPFYPHFSRRLTEILEREPAKRVGISLNYLSQALSAFAIIGFLKQRFPGVRIILGGGLVTSWLRSGDRSAMFSGLVDRMVAGPGERELLDWCGVSYRTDVKLLPDFGKLPMDDYLSPGRVLPYSESSGCWWNKCTFCPERAEGNPYQPVTPSRMADDIASLSASINPSLVHLLGNAVSPAHMRAVIANPMSAPWYGFARVTGELADEEFCHELRRSGCVMLKLGLESGDQAVLDALQKGMEIEMASRTLRALKKAGIAAFVYLLFGTPAEDRESALRTLDFTARHADAIDFLNLAIFNMPVLSPEAERLGTRSFYDGDLSLYTDFNHPKGWGRKEVRQFLDGTFKRHPAISPIINSEPPFFGSNHAPFFVLERR
ncbi:MAG: radical SAM protein [Nitrospiraceae bacterium]|nr:radical SAM protein [Nitrospiraceae bacterium]